MPKPNHVPVDYSAENFKIILKFLFEKEIFLASFDKLKEIIIFTNATHLNMDFQSFFKQPYLASFGIFNKNLSNLLEVIQIYFLC